MREKPIFNKSEWRGYVRYGFVYRGHEGVFVEPKERKKGNPWVWRAEFFEAFDYADMALLEQGYCRAYYRIRNKFGSPEAVEWMKSFHDFLVDSFDLAPQAAIFGFSRGGLYSVNYAAKYPNDVACLYLDAPVLDVKSWPLGKWAGEGSPVDVAMLLEEYRVADVESIDDIPLNKLEQIESVPVMLVYGEEDKTVPPAENAEVMMRQFGGTMEYIAKPNNDHHPHSLEQPEPIVAFVNRYYPL